MDSLLFTCQSLKQKKITPRELLEENFAQIQRKQEAIGAYIDWNEDEAFASIKENHQGLLANIPIAIKDNIAVKGHPCRCASQILKNYISPYDATAIAHLRHAGALPFGRLNMDEFAMGSTTQNSSFLTTKNPYDLMRSPGGSSGGSAAAVSSGMAIAALGSDTGGSVRQPASHCGVVGFKPSYGSISRFGLVAFGSSLDQIGTLTLDVRDARILFEVLKGHDPLDATSLLSKDSCVSEQTPKNLKGLRIGVAKEFLSEGLHPEVAYHFEQSLKALQKEGALLVDITLPHIKYAVATYYIIAPAEASSNLSRFDGVRYGRRKEGAKDIHQLYTESRGEGFGKEVKRRILLGTFTLSSGYYDAYYTQALKARTHIRKDFDQAFKNVDVILSPTSPEPAPLLGATKEDPLKEYLADIFTIPANLAGLPAISIPCGMAGDKKPLPIGLQLLTKNNTDSYLLDIAEATQNLLGVIPPPVLER